MNETPGETSSVRRVVIDSLPDPRSSHHPHCVITGDFVFVSGLVAERLADGTRVGVESIQGGQKHDVRAQLLSIFHQLDVILEAAETDKSHVVDVQVFLRGMTANFEIMNKIYGSYFGHDTPARTTVEVVRFPSDVVVELKVIAVRRGMRHV